VATSLPPTAVVTSYCSVVCLENIDFHYCRFDFSDQQWQGWQIQVVCKLSLPLQCWGEKSPWKNYEEEKKCLCQSRGRGQELQ